MLFGDKSTVKYLYSMYMKNKTQRKLKPQSNRDSIHFKYIFNDINNIIWGSVSCHIAFSGVQNAAVSGGGGDQIEVDVIILTDVLSKFVWTDPTETANWRIWYLF